MNITTATVNLAVKTSVLCTYSNITVCAQNSALEYLLSQNWLTCLNSGITAFPFCCALCAMKDGQKRKINIHIEKVNDVPKRHTENSRMVLHSHSQNILLILCFACALNQAHVFLFDRLYFTTLCASELFFFPCAGEGHVLSYSRPVRLTGLL